MADMPDLSDAAFRSIADPADAAEVVLVGGEVLPVLEETLTVSTRRRSTGTLRVSTTTESVEEIAEAELDRYRVEVTRVPVGRIVDAAPVARAEGDTTIIPVVEERLVLVKQLVLVEEVHIRHVLERETVSEPVTLRRQRVVIERPAPEGGTDAQRAGEDVDPIVPCPD